MNDTVSPPQGQVRDLREASSPNPATDNLNKAPQGTGGAANINQKGGWSSAPVAGAGPAPGAQGSGARYDLEYSLNGKPQQFKGLDDEATIKKLEQVYFMVLNDVKNGRQMQESWQKEHGRSVVSRWTAATAATIGGADWPDPADWGKVSEKMTAAYLMLRESRWALMANKGETLSADARAAAKPLDAQRVQQIVTILQEGDKNADHCLGRLKQFLDDTDKGASRTVTGLKVAAATGAVAATVLTGGAAAELGLGLAGTTTLVGVGGGTYAAGQNLAGQGGEIAVGARKDIDWSEVAKEGAVGAATSATVVVGGAAIGKVAAPLVKGAGKLIRPGAVAAADALAGKAVGGVAIKTAPERAGLLKRAWSWVWSRGAAEEGKIGLKIEIKKYTQHEVRELRAEIIKKYLPKALRKDPNGFIKWGVQFWGEGSGGAVSLIGKRSAAQLRAIGLTVENATVLRDFFKAVEFSELAGAAPAGRVQLLDRIIDVLQRA
jgi:hypothetical protein